jgi:DNA-binding MarR family transcriptional regulator
VTTWSVRSAFGLDGDAGTGADDATTFVIEESLGYLVNRAARVMAHDLADRLRSFGIGIGQWAILLFLWAREGPTQAELAKVVAIEPPTLARTLDRMVRDGLVTRKADARDARLTRVYLTTRGRALRDALVPEARAVNAATERRLTADEARTLRKLLVKLIAA